MTTIHPLSQTHPEMVEVRTEWARANNALQILTDRAENVAYSIMLQMWAEERTAPDTTDLDYFAQCQMAVDGATEEMGRVSRRHHRIEQEWQQFLKDTGRA